MKSTRLPLPLPLPLKEWMASDLSSLALLVIQIDGIHMDEDLILVAAIGVDATRPVPMPPQPR